MPVGALLTWLCPMLTLFDFLSDCRAEYTQKRRGYAALPYRGDISIPGRSEEGHSASRSRDITADCVSSRERHFFDVRSPAAWTERHRRGSILHRRIRQGTERCPSHHAVGTDDQDARTDECAGGQVFSATAKGTGRPRCRIRKSQKRWWRRKTRDSWRSRRTRVLISAAPVENQCYTTHQSYRKSQKSKSSTCSFGSHMFSEVNGCPFLCII